MAAHINVLHILHVLLWGRESGGVEGVTDGVLGRLLLLLLGAVPLLLWGAVAWLLVLWGAAALLLAASDGRGVPCCATC